MRLVRFCLIACAGWQCRAQDNTSAANRQLVVGKHKKTVSLSKRRKDYQYLASLETLYYGPSEPYTHTCGGSLIDAANGWIVTAAHCLSFNLEKAREMRVAFEARFTTDHKDINARTCMVNLAVSHANYNHFTLDHDIAMLRVDPTCTSDLTPIQVPDVGADAEQVGSPVKLIGWGSTDVDCEVYPVKLFEGEQEIHDPSDCKIEDAARQVCGVPFTKKSVEVGSGCGDSGGPLLHLNDDSSSTLVGIVSFGYDYGISDGFTRASFYKDWMSGIQADPPSEWSLPIICDPDYPSCCDDSSWENDDGKQCYYMYSYYDYSSCDADATQACPATCGACSSSPSRELWVLGEENQNKCPENSHRISSESDCAAAAESLDNSYKYKRAVNQKKSPKGCFLFKEKVFFNTHSKGRKKKKKNTNLPVGMHKCEWMGGFYWRRL